MAEGFLRKWHNGDKVPLPLLTSESRTLGEMNELPILSGDLSEEDLMALCGEVFRLNGRSPECGPETVEAVGWVVSQPEVHMALKGETSSLALAGSQVRAPGGSDSTASGSQGSGTQQGREPTVAMANVLILGTFLIGAAILTHHFLPKATTVPLKGAISANLLARKRMLAEVSNDSEAIRKLGCSESGAR